MYKAGILVALATAVSAEDFASIVAKVNAAGRGWRAEVPKRFNRTEDAKMLCGTWLEGHPHYVRLPQGKVDPVDALPTDFDARTQWGAKCPVITTVRDQSACGSCWAFGSTEAFEDRQCIATGLNREMSVEDTASCCTGFECGFSAGCNGGQPSSALQWMTEKGVVSGGDYDEVGKNVSCRPYTLAPCAHHVAPTPTYPACPSNEYPTPKCTAQCSSGYNQTYTQDKRKGKTAYSVRGVQDIMTELYTKGPLAVAFTVYADFPSYKSGVYKHTTGAALGGHAVEMIGWGVENNEPYWWIKNSWNDQWGDQGYFKILKGVNECGIEGDVTGISF
eukprot:TRINITY_DN9175_c0_g3_i1.p1 TRINITY_DN9175_c0_g3~~TRINITY_DN9175_c0_g3_i1.p1  ORF type:complete len:333 (+),score=119.85 TRINITY_DN9175_c0_g3_i1:38-1036(+)